MKKSQEPGQQFGPIGGRADQAIGLVAEVQEDGARIEHPGLAATRPFGVDNRRHFAVRIDGPKCRRVLLALARVDRNDFIRETGLL